LLEFSCTENKRQLLDFLEYHCPKWLENVSVDRRFRVTVLENEGFECQCSILSINVAGISTGGS
jgi:hypothetical protein